MMGWLCRVFGRGCPREFRPPSPVLAEMREHRRRVQRETETIRRRDPLVDALVGVPRPKDRNRG